jgi:hypothetical protein
VKEAREEPAKAALNMYIAGGTPTRPFEGVLMFLAFFTLLVLMAAVSAFVWLGWLRVASHLKGNPQAARFLAEHVITPLLLGEKEPTPEGQKEVKRTKGTLV